MLVLRRLILLPQVLIGAEPVKRKLTLNSILNICDNSESSFDAQSPTFQNLTIEFRVFTCQQLNLIISLS